MPKDNDIVEFKAIFHGFTNSTFCKMFVEPLRNSLIHPTNVPAMIEVNNPKLVKQMKTIQKGEVLELKIKRKVGSTGHNLAAELCKFKITSK